MFKTTLFIRKKHKVCIFGGYPLYQAKKRRKKKKKRRKKEHLNNP